MNRLVLSWIPLFGLAVTISSFAKEPSPSRPPCAADGISTGGTMVAGTGSEMADDVRALAAKDKNEKKVPGVILVLHASNSGGGVDPELRNLPQLKHPPFSSYDTYHLLSKQDIRLTKKLFATTKLPNGRVLKTALKEILPGGRYQVVASISKKAKKNKKNEDSFLPLLRVTAKGGETFFVAGQSYKKGILVIGIRVGSASKGKSGKPHAKK